MYVVQSPALLIFKTAKTLEGFDYFQFFFSYPTLPCFNCLAFLSLSFPYLAAHLLRFFPSPLTTSFLSLGTLHSGRRMIVIPLPSSFTFFFCLPNFLLFPSPLPLRYLENFSTLCSTRSILLFPSPQNLNSSTNEEKADKLHLIFFRCSKVHLVIFVIPCPFQFMTKSGRVWGRRRKKA